MKNRVLLGMSGGIDSSVSAMILQEQGFEVVGITFLFGDLSLENEKMLRDAKHLADKLNIKHFSVSLQKEFRKTVVKYFIDEYVKGRTPFPCAYCNPKIKFHYLNEFAKRENCEFIATGHYVQTNYHNNRKYIFQGSDLDKDQSFFLWGLPPNLISKLIFPLGKFNKQEIKKIAIEKGFETLSKKKESLGICFIDGNNYRKFLEKEGIKSKPGNFIDRDGAILGKHRGISNYTIGQRRGLGLNLNFPVFVAKINPEDNEIVLGKYKELYKNKITIENYYIIDIQDVSSDHEIIMKVRYRLQETPCKIHILSESRAEVVLLKPEAMIANGQTAVFYIGTRLIGGGFIESSE